MEQPSIEQVERHARAGVTRGGIEAVLGRRLTDAELVVFRRVQAERKLDGRARHQARNPSGGAMTVNELGELQPVADPARRERCRLDLLAFGLSYCMSEYDAQGALAVKRILRRPPSPRMERFVRELQETVRNGGNRHVRWPRGKGKTTWVKIAVLWCMAYGHRGFVVVVAATKPMAEEAVAEIWTYAAEDAHFAEDFPEVVQPLADVALTPQRMRHQTYHGAKTHVADNARFGYKRFARLDGMPWTGGVIAWRGADQAIRGLNIGSDRPDFVFIDDPQTDMAPPPPRRSRRSRTASRTPS